MEDQNIRLEGQDGVALLTLNRPEVLNALNEPMRLELMDALAAAEADPAGPRNCF